MTTAAALLTSSDLFTLVELLRVYPDSKAFPDRALRTHTDEGTPLTPDAIEAAFQTDMIAAFGQRLPGLVTTLNDPQISDSQKLIAIAHLMRHLSVELQHFTDAHCEPPVGTGQPVLERIDMEGHLNRMWDELARQPEQIAREAAQTTLMPLPHPYIVPGGRYLEMFYWDSYFIAVGLAATGRQTMARNIVDNAAHLIETLGYIPNGSRHYFLERSQTPYFGFMLDLLRATAPDIWAEAATRERYLAALRREYAFWMAETGEQAGRRVVVDEAGLNRYWSGSAAPRPEGYYEDIGAAYERGLTDVDEHTSQEAANLYRNLRAACESGWDFSTRWLHGESYPLHSIRTTRILPLDLNCMLYHYERRLADFSPDEAEAGRYRQRAAERKRILLRHFWDAEQQWFIDCLIPDSALAPDLRLTRPVRGDELRSTGILSIAGIFPLFCGLLDASQPDEGRLIEQTVDTLVGRFEFPGGIVNSLTRRSDGSSYGQQWDYPNGWPTHQWVTVAALEQYGYHEHARRIAQRVVDTARAVYDSTGKMMEKYNVVDPRSIAGGGEYRTQEGFGWTNGVVAGCLTYLAHGAWWIRHD